MAVMKPGEEVESVYGEKTRLTRPMPLSCYFVFFVAEMPFLGYLVNYHRNRNQTCPRVFDLSPFVLLKYIVQRSRLQHTISPDFKLIGTRFGQSGDDGFRQSTEAAG